MRVTREKAGAQCTLDSLPSFTKILPCAHTWQHPAVKQARGVGFVLRECNVLLGDNNTYPAWNTLATIREWRVQNVSLLRPDPLWDGWAEHLGHWLL